MPKDKADRAFDVATCIGCGACVAACPNGSASLFLGAKITHLGELPQGQAERDRRVVNMVAQHDPEGFGGCTNIGECTAACPKEIPLDVISRLNWDLHAALRHGQRSDERDCAWIDQGSRAGRCASDRQLTGPAGLPSLPGPALESRRRLPSAAFPSAACAVTLGDRRTPARRPSGTAPPRVPPSRRRVRRAAAPRAGRLGAASRTRRSDGGRVALGDQARYDRTSGTSGGRWRGNARPHGEKGRAPVRPSTGDGMGRPLTPG